MMLSPHDLERSAEHAETFYSPEETEHEGTLDSYEKHGRLKPVYGVRREKGGKLVNAVIDGWKYVLFARKNGIEKVYVCILTFPENADPDNGDLMKIMVQLQRSNHDSFMALFLMIQALWKKHSKGQGFRSDLTDKELEELTEGPEGGKRLNIYERIGKELSLSGNKVKHIRKVGMVNSLHFERIEIGRFTLYAAYLECVKQENGVLPEAPAVKPPVYHSDSTEPPVYSEPTTTEYTSEQSEENDQSGSPDEDITDTPEESGASNDVHIDSTAIPAEDIQESSEYILIEGVCQCCGQLTKIKIDKTQLK
jgi:hypothetical protein